MKLRSVQPDEIPLVEGWLSEKENYQWLDFGHGVQTISSIAIKVMLQQNTQFLRLFTEDTEEEPIGLVAFNDVSRPFKTANLWYVLGDKRYSGQGYTTKAVSKFLGLGFSELALNMVSAWAVVQNIPSIKVLENNNFRLIGEKRQCHYLDGKPHNRLLFDLLASEYKEL